MYTCKLNYFYLKVLMSITMKVAVHASVVQRYDYAELFIKTFSASVC